MTKTQSEFVMPADHLRAMLAGLLVQTSKDATRPFLCGVYFAPEGAIVVTDGHRLACVDFAFPFATRGGVVPRGEIEILLATLKPHCGSKRAPAAEVTMRFTATGITVGVGPSTLILAYDKSATFPPYAKVIPEIAETHVGFVRVNAGYIYDALALCKAASGDEGIVYVGDTETAPLLITPDPGDGMLWAHVKGVRCVVMPVRTTASVTAAKAARGR